MCAFVDSKATLRKSKCKKREIWVYKVVNRVKIPEPILISICYPYRWKLGINKSGSKLRLQTVDNKKINKGFHVFLNKKTAKKYNSQILRDGSVVLRLRANLNDLICVDNWPVNDITPGRIAVFKKVELLEKDYKEALND